MSVVQGLYCFGVFFILSWTTGQDDKMTSWCLASPAFHGSVIAWYSCSRSWETGLSFSTIFSLCYCLTQIEVRVKGGNGSVKPFLVKNHPSLQWLGSCINLLPASLWQGYRENLWVFSQVRMHLKKINWRQ